MGRRITGRYLLARSRNLPGFLHSSRTGADAVSALIKWEAANPTRRFETLDADHAGLVANLEFDEMDADRAAAQLYAACSEVGLNVSFLGREQSRPAHSGQT